VVVLFALFAFTDLRDRCIAPAIADSAALAVGTFDEGWFLAGIQLAAPAHAMSADARAALNSSHFDLSEG